MNSLMFVMNAVGRNTQLWGVEERTIAEQLCFHCGDPVREEHVHFDGKEFCCSGCRAVFSLLQESGLCDYYEYGERPGIKEEPDPTAIRPELFELPEVREKLVEFSVDGVSRVRLHVPQMHCSSCIWLLENLERLEPAIIRSRVRFAEKELTVTFHEDRLPLGLLVLLLGRIGYPPIISDGGKAGTKRTKGIPRKEFVKLGVAGFAFGNIMLFSFPEYLGADATDGELLKGFQLLNLLFSLPVVFFSAAGFFRSAWAGLRLRTVNIDVPIALGIVALFARSAWDVFTGSGPGYFDSLAGLVFFLLVGRWYQAYTYQAMSFDRTLDDFLPLVVIRKRGGIEEAVNVAELRIGDRIIIRDQELIPVDGSLRAGVGNIDNSFITGESVPTERAVGDAIHAGGRQRGGAIEVEVVRPFEQSRMKQLWEEHAGAADRPSMPRLIDAVARRFTLAVILLSIGAGIYWAGRDAHMVWPVVTAILIVACPCALALSMPFAYGHAMRILGRNGLFLRDSDVVERLSRVDTVLFDKTGTLTAREVFDVRFHGVPLTEDEMRRVRSVARNSTHPLSVALYHALKGDTSEAIEVEEVPGQGVQGTVEGMRVRVGSAHFTEGRLVAGVVGHLQVHIAIAGMHRGHFTMRKRTRKGMALAVNGVRRFARVFLLTGDISVDPEVGKTFRKEEVFTDHGPRQKADLVAELQLAGSTVLMVGDGLNDAGALQRSDVGISVSESSVALTPASDAILDAKAIDRVPGALLLARRARRVVMVSLAISLLYNVVGVSFAVAGHLTPLLAAVLMPLSSVTVVGFVTLAVSLAARSIGTGKDS